MKTPIMTRETLRLQSSLRWTVQVSGLAALFLLAALPVRAADVPVPWECSNYNGEAQIRCLNTFIEFQRDKIGQLEGELQAQKGAVGRLKEQVDLQAAMTANLERQLSDRSASRFAPAPYGYAYSSPFPYVYSPGFGLGLYFGRLWGYGPFYSLRPHWGFRHHHHAGHHH